MGLLRVLLVRYEPVPSVAAAARRLLRTMTWLATNRGRGWQMVRRFDPLHGLVYRITASEAGCKPMPVPSTNERPRTADSMPFTTRIAVASLWGQRLESSP